MTTIGKLWTGAVAYVSLLVGAGLSVAGNLADTYRTRGADVDNLDKIMAAAWPILVLLAIHMFVSERWSDKILFQVWRWIGVLGVGVLAMIVSWFHLHDLMVSRGQLPIVAVLGPLAIDGMAIMATGLILSTRVHGQTGAPAPQVAADTNAAAMAAKVDSLPDATVTVAGRFDDGRDRWADLIDADTAMMAERLSDFRSAMTDAAMATADEIVLGAREMDDVATDAAKLNGLATWHEWTPDDDRAVAAMAAASEPLPKRTRTPAGQSYPQELVPLYLAWLSSPDAPPRADMVKLLAGHFQVSERSARRWLRMEPKES